MTPGAPMATAAQAFQAGGEVAGSGGPFGLSNPSPIDADPIHRAADAPG
jgi:hypothetical protein